MTQVPSEAALAALVARFSDDKTIDPALVRALAVDRAQRNAWFDAFKRRIAEQLQEAKRARDEGRAAAESDARLALEKDALRALVQAVDAELRASAPMPCLKIRAPRLHDDSDD